MNTNTDAHEVKSFETDVLARSAAVPVVVDFWAAWCGPCRVLGPVLERLAESSEGEWELAKVDVDAHQDIAGRYGVSGIPAVKMFVDGNVVGEFTGALPQQMVAQWLKRFLPAKSAKETARAEELIARGNPEEAGEILKSILVSEPDNRHVRTVLAATLLFSDRQQATALVQDIEEDSADFPTVEMIRTIAGLGERRDHPESLQDDEVKGMYLDAVNHLFAHRYDDALNAFIAVIRLLGDDHEFTRSHRRDFGSALNS
jgi:putative thioredoxin